MREKATIPAIVIGVIVAIVVVYFIGKTFMASSPTNNEKPVYPSFIDPSTGKPWEGKSNGSGQSAPTGGSPNTGSPGSGGSPGSPSGGGGMTGSPNSGGAPGGR